MQNSSVLKNMLSTKPNMRIKLLGDSITHGVGGTGFAQNGEPIVAEFCRNPDGYCWAKNFKDYLEKGFNCSVTNNACTGTTIQFIINNFDKLVDPEDDFIICTIGTNNRHKFFKDGEKPTREEYGLEFYNYIVKLCDMLKAANKEFLFIANIPSSAQNEKDGEEFWRILHMDDINAIYKSAANKHGFSFISLYDLFCEYCKNNNIDHESLLCDGLHPNDRGYDIMYELLLKAFCFE